MPETGSYKPAALVGFGEILLRLSAQAPALLFQEKLLEASFCGAEANVMVAMAGFGHDCRMVTALPDNAVGTAALQAIRQFGVEARAVRQSGSRMGLYFLQPGAMGRPSAIAYDRAGSAFSTTSAQTYKWAELLEGWDWLYLSGITPALGDEPLAAMREAIVAAKAAGIRIAFDTNFRPALWRGREELAARTLRELAFEADIVFAGRRAVAMMVGGSYDQADGDEGFYAAAQHLLESAPRVARVAATRRTIHSTDRQDIVGLLADREGLAISRTVALDKIVDRVGTGDAFAAGILHGIVSGMDRTATVEFAAACSHWAHSVPGDFMRASSAEIASLQGGGDVSR